MRLSLGYSQGGLKYPGAEKLAPTPHLVKGQMTRWYLDAPLSGDWLRGT